MTTTQQPILDAGKRTTATPRVPRKPRGNCNLKTIGPDRQDRLYEYMEGVGDEKGHTYAECITWLMANMNIETSRTTLCNWRKSYITRMFMADNSETAAQIVEAHRERAADPAASLDYTEEAIQATGTHIFNVQAIRTCDDKAWVRLQTLSLRKQEFLLKEKRFEFDRQKHAESSARTAAPAVKMPLTVEQKRERVRKILGTE